MQYPSLSVGLIFGFGAPIAVAYPGLEDGAPRLLRSFVTGLHDRHAVVASSQWQAGVQADLTPIGAHVLLGMPLRELTNRAVEVELVLGSEAARLPEQLAEATSWAARYLLLDEVLLARLAAAREPPIVTLRAWSRLSELQGRISVAELAVELGTSRQHMAQEVRERLGFPPKTLARILRFQRALALLEDHSHRGAAALAWECGYFDQAHFNRDFRQLTGSTPSEHLARRMPNGLGVASG